MFHFVGRQEGAQGWCFGPFVPDRSRGCSGHTAAPPSPCWAVGGRLRWPGPGPAAERQLRLGPGSVMEEAT